MKNPTHTPQQCYSYPYQSDLLCKYDMKDVVLCVIQDWPGQQTIIALLENPVGTESTEQ